MTNELKKAINRMFKYDGDMDMTKEGINESSIEISKYEIAENPKIMYIENSVFINSKMNFKERLWILLTNPIYYLFKGKWRI